MSGGEESKLVLPDPQYSVGKLLRPQPNFVDVYQGASITNPIYLYPDGQPRDDDAGNVGFNPDLIRGLAVTPGQSLLIWVPDVSYVSGGDPTQIESYEWLIGWRMRNLRDFRTTRKGWHLAAREGTPDSSVSPAQARTPLPCAWETLWFNSTRPTPANAVDSGRVVTNVNAESFTAGGTVIRGPLLDAAGTEGVLQQGVADPATLPLQELPTWLPVQKIAKGDEMLLALRRQNGPATYDFEVGLFPTGSDLPLAQILSDATGQVLPLQGVYVFRGVDNGTLTSRSDLEAP